jgi:hypothetical protein
MNEENNRKVPGLLPAPPPRLTESSADSPTPADSNPRLFRGGDGATARGFVEGTPQWERRRIMHKILQERKV